MPTHLELPRSGDDPLAINLDRPLEFDAGPTLEVEPVSLQPGSGALIDDAVAVTVANPPVTAAPPPAALPEAVLAGARDQAQAPGKDKEEAKTGPKLRRTRRRAKRRWDAPAWMVSALIHLGILGGLAAIATTSGEVVKRLASIDSALIVKSASDELTPIYADPTDAPRDELNGDTAADPGSPSQSYSTGGASAGALVLKSTGRAMGARHALPSMGSVSAPSNLSMTSATPTRDLSGGGGIGGDVTNTVGEVGEALDQVAREILRHLSQHRLTVVWLFDESESMRDDQKTIKNKFDRVVNELKINTPNDGSGEPAKSTATTRRTGPPLDHAIVGFGDKVHFEQDKPTTDIALIGKAIDRLRIDSTGKENTMAALVEVISHYANLITSDRRLLIVLATDESGDDGGYVEEARQAALKNKVPVYIIGRQALFGTDHLTINYTDPVTKDEYHVGIKRGPETADVENLQYDGLHGRWDELPSGFAPYELARIAKDTGGIYFILPSEEELRIRKREKAFSIETLKEYVPDYESRQAYLARRNGSELRKTIRDVIAITKDFPYRHHYSVIPQEMLTQIEQELPVVTERLNALIAIEQRLRGIEKFRDREPEKRWQAAYDLMLAQVVAYQIKAYEYRANLQEMATKVPQPKKQPTPELTVAWSLDHNQEAKAPREKTEKVYAEALRLCKLVIERHPNTPWADLAQDEINRGFSIKRSEWHHQHSNKFEERRKLVPKF